MSDVSTKVTITAQAQGFSQAQQQASKFCSVVDKGLGAGKISASKFKKEMHEMEHTLQSIAKKQLALNDAMKGMDKGSHAFKEATEALEGMEHQAEATEKRIKMLTKAFGSEKAHAMHHAHGGFTQGLLSGMLPGLPHGFLDRGPGVWREMAGHVAGHKVGHMAAGLASVPLHGIKGISHAMSAVPFIGAAAGGMLEEAGAMTGGAIENIKKRQELRPFLSGLSGLTVAGKEPESFSSRMKKHPPPAPLGEKDLQALTADLKKHAGPGAGSGKLAASWGAIKAKEGHYPYPGGIAPPDPDELMKPPPAQKKAPKRVDFVASMGMGFGMSRMETEEFAGQLARKGGGRGKELATQGMLEASLGAKRAYGVEAETSGAFLKAGRHGGMGEEFVGKGGDALAKTISSGLMAGLEGSDLTGFMEEMASGIEEWKTTGIVIDPRSVVGIGKEAAKLGLGVERGMNVSKDISTYGARMAKGGPQTGLDFMAARELYGYEVGSGAKGAWEFQKRASRGAKGIQKGGIEKLLTRVAGKYEDPNEAKRYAYAAFEGAGIKMSPDELDDLFEILRAKKSGKHLDKKQRKKLHEAGTESDALMKEAREVDTVGKLGKKGRAATDQRLGGVADLENQKDVIGQKMIPAIHAFEKASLNMIQGLTNTIAPAVTAIGRLAEGLSHRVVAGTKGNIAGVVLGGH